MVDINLLPEELRKKEQKEKEAAQKAPHAFEIKMSAPNDQKIPKNTGSLIPIDIFDNKDTLPTPQKPLEKKEDHFTRQKDEYIPQGIPLKNTFPVNAPQKTPLNFDEIHTAPKVEKKIDPSKKSSKDIPHTEHKKIGIKKKVVLPTSDIFPIGIPKKRNHFNFFAFLKSLFHFKKREKENAEPHDSVSKDIKDIKIIPPTILLPKQEIKNVTEGVTKKVEEPIVPKVVTPLKTPLDVKEAIFAPLKQEVYQKSVKVDKPGQSGLDASVEKPFHTLEINLIPQDYSGHIAGPNISRNVIVLGLSVLASFIVVILAFTGLKIYEGQIGAQVVGLDTSIEEKKKQIAEYEKERLEAETLQSKLNLLDGLLSNHVYWSRVFEALENHTIDDVYFLNFTASRDGTLALSAIGKDYTSVARQLVAFQEAKDFVLLVTINSASAEASTDDDKPKIIKTNFDVKLKLVPEIFFMRPEDNTT